MGEIKMSIQVAIIGLDQVGASIGLALEGQKTRFTRVGHDREFSLARRAEKKGVVDKVTMNLPGAVEGADIVILAVPQDQVRETLEVIAPDLRENCVVLDTSPIKRVVMDWATALLPRGRYFVGLTPIINGAYLQTYESGLDSARADLFKNGLLGIVSPAGTPEAALRLATDLASLLGADHLFLDPVEVDSHLASLHLLPQLAAAALIQTASHQPGWRDGIKMTGRAFAEQVFSISHLDEPGALAMAAQHSREHTLRAIDQFIQTLYVLRDEVEEEGSELLAQDLTEARQAYLNWLGERLPGQWSARELADQEKTPGAGEVFGRLFGIRPQDSQKKGRK
jgi:prephenate dehydrogenase